MYPILMYMAIKEIITTSRQAGYWNTMDRRCYCYCYDSQNRIFAKYLAHQLPGHNALKDLLVIQIPQVFNLIRVHFK